MTERDGNVSPTFLSHCESPSVHFKATRVHARRPPCGMYGNHRREETISLGKINRSVTPFASVQRGSSPRHFNSFPTRSTETNGSAARRVGVFKGGGEA